MPIPNNLLESLIELLMTLPLSSEKWREIQCYGLNLNPGLSHREQTHISLRHRSKLLLLNYLTEKIETNAKVKIYCVY